MSNPIDITFYIEDESTTSRALIYFSDVSRIKTATIANFSGSSGGLVYAIELSEAINPFADFYVGELYMNQEMFDSFKDSFHLAINELLDVEL